MKMFKVYGDDDFAALEFERNFNPEEVFKEMIVNNETEKTVFIVDSESEVYIEMLKFNTPEELFDYYKAEMQDYDEAKHTNFYKL